MLGPTISENDPPFLLYGSLQPTNLEKKWSPEAHLAFHLLIKKTNKDKAKDHMHTVIRQNIIRERSGSVVECLTQDRGVAGFNLTFINVLVFEQDTLILA